MPTLDIIRAWKDAEYRNSLTEAQRALLPENPAGLIELTDQELDTVAGSWPQSVSSPCPETIGVPCTGKWRTLYCCADL